MWQMKQNQTIGQLQSMRIPQSLNNVGVDLVDLSNGNFTKDL
jgi:hypothetical protein